ncbi:quinone-dependent D-lactate dehydrogenase-like isoform X2 [Zophobas morio]|uniref:quinone-dependent D-lactate dehydrogenase-like isoform X2 n=1 Tax=Zophobas morio TaxID=2755281 RepID=UPI003082E492
MGEFGNGELERSEEKLLSFLENERKKGESIEVFKCANEKEVQSVMTFRFAVAAAFKTYNEGKGYRGISVDYALRKNDFSVPVLPFDREKNFPEPTRRLRYMHFACNVAHEDLSFPPSFQKALKANGIRLPAEHGHGVEYEAPPETQQRWRELDPLNMMNPGVGKTSFKRNYA